MHAIYDKDVFRLLKEDKVIDSTLNKQPAGKMSLIDFQNCKYKKRSDLIMDFYKNPKITED